MGPFLKYNAPKHFEKIDLRGENGGLVEISRGLV